MANKIIPDLDELAGAEMAAGHLVVVDTGLETFKAPLSTLAGYLASFRPTIDVPLEGTETGEVAVDVSAHVKDATKHWWGVRKPSGAQMPALAVRASNATTVIIDLGAYSLEGGTYKLLGV
jgi:hypothetical protein